MAETLWENVIFGDMFYVFGFLVGGLFLGPAGLKKCTPGLFLGPAGLKTVPPGLFLGPAGLKTGPPGLFLGPAGLKTGPPGLFLGPGVLSKDRHDGGVNASPARSTGPPGLTPALEAPSWRPFSRRNPLKGPQKGPKKGLKNNDFGRILTGF